MLGGWSRAGQDSASTHEQPPGLEAIRTVTRTSAWGKGRRRLVLDQVVTTAEPRDRLLQAVFDRSRRLPAECRPGRGDVGLPYGRVVLGPGDELDRRPGTDQLAY